MKILAVDASTHGHPCDCTTRAGKASAPDIRVPSKPRHLQHRAHQSLQDFDRLSREFEDMSSENTPYRQVA
jgi:hypothetical protein